MRIGIKGHRLEVREGAGLSVGWAVLFGAGIPLILMGSIAAL
jgi:hypothetical protein